MVVKAATQFRSCNRSADLCDLHCALRQLTSQELALRNTKTPDGSLQNNVDLLECLRENFVLSGASPVYAQNHAVIGAVAVFANSVQQCSDQSCQDLGTVLAEASSSKQLMQLEFRKTSSPSLQHAPDNTKLALEWLMENGAAAVFKCDANGKCSFVNEQWKSLTGASEHEAANNGWMQSVHSEDVDKVTNAWQTALSDQRDFSQSFRFERKNGSTLDVFGRAKVFFSAEGQVDFILGTVSDQTELKLAQHQAAVFRQALDLGGLVTIKDSNRKIVYANSAFCSTFGFTSEQLIGKSASIFDSEEMNAESGQDIISSTAAGKTWKGEICNRNQSGELLWFESVIVPLIEKSGEPVGTVTFRLDITERKRSQTQFIKETSALQKALIDSGVYAIVATDEKGVIKSFNTAAEILYECSADDVVDKVNISRLHPEDFKQVVGEIQEDVPLRSLAGRRFYGSVACSSQRNGRNEVSGFIEITYDTSSKKARSDNLAKERLQLISSNSDLEEFASIASHDLKEPLRGIHNYATFLKEDYSSVLDEEGLKRLHKIESLSMRMEVIIDSLLYYSKLGRSELAMKETSLDEVVKDVLESLQLNTRNDNVEIVYQRPLPAVRCDYVRVRELFFNLIQNAIKYNNKSHKIVEIGYRSSNEEDLPTFFVRDNGIGISPEHKSEIFRMFRRLHGRDKFGGGSGLGLSIVKKIVDRHHGSIWIESELESFTCFNFTLGAKRYDKESV